MTSAAKQQAMRYSRQKQHTPTFGWLMNVESQGLCADGKCQNSDFVVSGMDMLLIVWKHIEELYIEGPCYLNQ
jgi:hypothetical protein